MRTGGDPSPPPHRPQSSRGDLRLEEDEDEDQQGRHHRGKHHPDGERGRDAHGVDEPTPGRAVGHLQPSGHLQFLRRRRDGRSGAAPRSPPPRTVCTLGSPRAPHPPAGTPPYLRVGVLDEEVSHGHDEDGDGHPEVPDQAPDLRGRRTEPPCVPPPPSTWTPSHSGGVTTAIPSPPPGSPCRAGTHCS